MLRLAAAIRSSLVLVLVLVSVRAVSGQQESREHATPGGVSGTFPSIGHVAGRGDEIGGGEMMGGPGMGGRGQGSLAMAGPQLVTRWYPSRPVSGSGADGEIAMVRQELSAAVPVWRQAGSMLMLSGSVKKSVSSTGATLPDSESAFPDRLASVRIGTDYMKRMDNGWFANLALSVESASDRPFHSLNEMSVSFKSLLRIPARNRRDAWQLSLIYSPASGLGIPIPGVAYVWHASDTFRASIGMPPSVMWQPVDDLSIDLSYVPLSTVNARATYRATDGLSLHAGLETRRESYWLADRGDMDERLMEYEQQLVAGVRKDLWRTSVLDLNVGWTVERYYGVTEDLLHGPDQKIDVDSGASLSLGISRSF